MPQGAPAKARRSVGLTCRQVVLLLEVLSTVPVPGVVVRRRQAACRPSPLPGGTETRRTLVREETVQKDKGESLPRSVLQVSFVIVFASIRLSPV